MLRLAGVSRVYHLGGQEVRALDGVDLEVAEGELIRVVGASGSGKSTLLNLIAGLDRPTAGGVQTPVGDLARVGRRTLAAWRARWVGMVFQSFNLVPHRDALANVELGLLFTPTPRRERLRRAQATLERLGLGDRLHHHPADLSGGERQRVAFARALVKDPSLLLADEPTGNLDRDNAAEIASLLSELNAGGVTVLLVTHDPELAAGTCHRTVSLRYGRVAAETPGSRPAPEPHP